jgi:hypothetical protein
LFGAEQWEKIFAADAGFPDRHQQRLGIVEALLDGACEKPRLKPFDLARVKDRGPNPCDRSLREADVTRPDEPMNHKHRQASDDRESVERSQQTTLLQQLIEFGFVKESRGVPRAVSLRLQCRDALRSTLDRPEWRRAFELPHEGKTLLYRASKLDCNVCPLKPQGYAGVVFNAFGPPNELRRTALERSQSHQAYVQEQCRRDNLAPGGFGACIHDRVDAGDITAAEPPILVRSLLSAGIDTTVNGIGAAIFCLARFPEARLRNDPSLARNAFEEAIRFESPVQSACANTRVANMSGRTGCGAENRRLSRLSSPWNPLIVKSGQTQLPWVVDRIAYVRKSSWKKSDTTCDIPVYADSFDLFKSLTTSGDKQSTARRVLCSPRRQRQSANPHASPIESHYLTS